MTEQQQEDGETGHVDQRHHSVGHAVLDEASKQLAVETTGGKQPEFPDRFGSEQHDGVEAHGGELRRNGRDRRPGDAPSGNRTGTENQHVIQADVQQRRDDVDPHHHGGAAPSGEETREGTAEQEREAAQAEDPEVADLQCLDGGFVTAPGEDWAGQRGEQGQQHAGRQREVDGLPERGGDAIGTIGPVVLRDEGVGVHRHPEGDRKQGPVHHRGRHRGGQGFRAVPGQEDPVDDVHQRDGTRADDQRQGDLEQFADAAGSRFGWRTVSGRHVRAPPAVPDGNDGLLKSSEGTRAKSLG